MKLVEREVEKKLLILLPKTNQPDSELRTSDLSSILQLLSWKAQFCAHVILTRNPQLNFLRFLVTLLSLAFATDDFRIVARYCLILFN